MDTKTYCGDTKLSEVELSCSTQNELKATQNELKIALAQERKKYSIEILTEYEKERVSSNQGSSGYASLISITESQVSNN